MTVIVKTKASTLPAAVRQQAGFKVSGGVVTILPKLPTADDEYTPEQRRIIDTQLDEAQKGPFHGPFNTADEMIAHMKKRAALKKSRRSRWRLTISPVPRKNWKTPRAIVRQGVFSSRLKAQAEAIPPKP